jgi:hypothetical protein
MPMRTDAMPPLTGLIVSLLVLAGISMRLMQPPATPTDPGVSAERALASFLSGQGLARVKRVHYTADAGITGVQAWSPACRGFLHVTVMPEGDELLGLWQSRSRRAGNRTAYLYQNQLFKGFPSFAFWRASMLHALGARIGIRDRRTPEPVVALSFSERCQHLTQLPWTQFSFQGENR